MVLLTSQDKTLWLPWPLCFDEYSYLRGALHEYIVTLYGDHNFSNLVIQVVWKPSCRKPTFACSLSHHWKISFSLQQALSSTNPFRAGFVILFCYGDLKVADHLVKTVVWWLFSIFLHFGFATWENMMEMCTYMVKKVTCAVSSLSWERTCCFMFGLLRLISDTQNSKGKQPNLWGYDHGDRAELKDRYIEGTTKLGVQNSFRTIRSITWFQV